MKFLASWPHVVLTQFPQSFITAECRNISFFEIRALHFDSFTSFVSENCHVMNTLQKTSENHQLSVHISKKGFTPSKMCEKADIVAIKERFISSQVLTEATFEF